MHPLDSQSTRDTADEHPSHEPSMEEILASIRRIIADDQSLTAHRLQPAFESFVETAEVLETPALAEQAPAPRKSEALPPEEIEPSVSHRPVPDDTKRLYRRESKAPYTVPTAPPAEPRAAMPAASRANETSDLRFRASLDPFIVSQPSIAPVPPPPFEPVMEEPVTVADEPLISPKTDAAVATSFNALFASKLLPDRHAIADMTRDLLRPMLKAWLDDNLPVMVERLVRAEIERVARGGH